MELAPVTVWSVGEDDLALAEGRDSSVTIVDRKETVAADDYGLPEDVEK